MGFQLPTSTGAGFLASTVSPMAVANLHSFTIASLEKHPCLGLAWITL